LNAATIVRQAAEEGVNLTLTSAGTIKAVGDDKAVARWFAILRKRKSDIVDYLNARYSEPSVNSRWATEDWLALYDERAAIAEFDGGLPRAQAEAAALACCIVDWLSRNPVRSPPGRCLTCCGGDHGSDPLLPFGIETTGHAWLHSRCWPSWLARRRIEAVAALRAMGIAAAGASCTMTSPNK
jgi:hypothetical protein